MRIVIECEEHFICNGETPVFLNNFVVTTDAGIGFKSLADRVATEAVRLLRTTPIVKPCNSATPQPCNPATLKP